MLNGSLFVLVILVAVIAGIVIGFVLKQLFAAKKIKSSESLAARIVEESKKEAEAIKKEEVLPVKKNNRRKASETRQYSGRTKRKARGDSGNFFGGSEEIIDPVYGSGRQTRCRAYYPQN